MIILVARQNLLPATAAEQESRGGVLEFEALNSGVWLADHQKWLCLNGKLAYPGRGNPIAEGPLVRVEEGGVFGTLRLLNSDSHHRLRLVVDGQIGDEDLGFEREGELGREWVVDGLLPGDEIALVGVNYLDDKELIEELAVMKIGNEKYNPVITKAEDDPDGIVYHILSLRDVDALADEIIGQVRRSGKRYKGVIEFLQGGRFLSNKLAGALGFSEEKGEVISYGSRSYKDIGVAGKVEVYYRPNIPADGLWLVGEDVVDSGRTLQRFRQEYPDVEIDVAALGEKPNELGVVADYVGRRVEGVWLCFPWEMGELLAIKLFKSPGWRKLTLEQAMGQFLKIGFPLAMLREAVADPRLLQAGMEKAGVAERDRRDAFELSGDLLSGLERAVLRMSRQAKAEVV